VVSKQFGHMRCYSRRWKWFNTFRKKFLR